VKPKQAQIEQWQEEAPYRPITHEDMLAEAARRVDEKDLPLFEQDPNSKAYLEEAAKKGKPPF
jgi:hypothetical protein